MRHKNADSRTQVHHEEKANPQDISDTGYEATCLQAKMGGPLICSSCGQQGSQLMAHDLSPYLPEGYVLGPETIDPFPAKDSL